MSNHVSELDGASGEEPGLRECQIADWFSLLQKPPAPPRPLTPFRETRPNLFPSIRGQQQVVRTSICDQSLYWDGANKNVKGSWAGVSVLKS